MVFSVRLESATTRLVLHGVKAAFHALHGGIKRLQVDCNINAILFSSCRFTSRLAVCVLETSRALIRNQCQAMLECYTDVA